MTSSHHDIALANEKMQFAANITHDLLSPIAGIKSTAEVLINTHTHSSDEERLLKNIVNTTTQMTKFIDHVLKMSKESSTEEAIYTFSLRQLIADVIEIVSLSAEAKNLAIYIDASKDRVITADRYRCFRVLLNLVENAIKYTQKGHVLIRFTCENERIILDVEDTGIGISKEKQVDIFNCYTQLEAGSLLGEGIGLGLHLALLFAKQIGGEITIRSKKNKGSVFSFSFIAASE
ncbi:MAG: HAMP domain-containing histidine kinase [Legionellales bacterium]|nr:HAMP domain-containing histidine kinase [Legionellales bacterium]